MSMSTNSVSFATFNFCNPKAVKASDDKATNKGITESSTIPIGQKSKNPDDIAPASGKTLEQVLSEIKSKKEQTRLNTGVSNQKSIFTQ